MMLTIISNATFTLSDRFQNKFFAWQGLWQPADQKKKKKAYGNPLKVAVNHVFRMADNLGTNLLVSPVPLYFSGKCHGNQKALLWNVGYISFSRFGGKMGNLIHRALKPKLLISIFRKNFRCRVVPCVPQTWYPTVNQNEPRCTEEGPCDPCGTCHTIPNGSPHANWLRILMGYRDHFCTSRSTRSTLKNFNILHWRSPCSNSLGAHYPYLNDQKPNFSAI